MADPGALGFVDAERLLLTGEFGALQTLWSSSNYVFLTQMCGGDGEQFAAVYKPLKGERPLWDFPSGLYRREVAAYRLALLLDWPFIPPTIVRDGPHGIGSLQVFVDHDQQSHFFEQREQPALIPQLKRMAVFDYIANNADRKGGHCLLDAKGRVWGIDHGLCFHAQYKMRTVIWDWADETVPAGWLKHAEEAGLAIAARDERAEPLLELLDEDEANAILGRIETLLNTKKFPTPGPHRHYPWPLV